MTPSRRRRISCPSYSFAEPDPTRLADALRHPPATFGPWHDSPARTGGARGRAAASVTPPIDESIRGHTREEDQWGTLTHPLIRHAALSVSESWRRRSSDVRLPLTSSHLRVARGPYVQRLCLPHLFVALCAILVITGCHAWGQDQRNPVTSTATKTRPVGKRSLDGLSRQDWARLLAKDLDCAPINRGVEIVGIRLADVRGVGVKDAFVWADCYHETSPWPHQLEVFDGASDPAAPRRIAVLIRANEHALIRSVSFAGRHVVVDGTSYAPNDPNCCPSLRLHRVFVWTGDHFRRKSG